MMICTIYYLHNIMLLIAGWDLYGTALAHIPDAYLRVGSVWYTALTKHLSSVDDPISDA